MRVELRPITSIKPYDNNPRHNDGAVDAVANSIKEFGFRQPVVVDGEGVVIVGHTRLKAAQKLGLTEVPVHVANNLTPAQVKAYRIADNQTATIATWDDGLLAQELAALQGEGFDLSLTGFDGDELQSLLAPEPSSGQGDPDEVPESPAKPITQPGDLWHLGRHRLLCGDATSNDDMARLMDAQHANLLMTDPPYNVAYTGGTKEALTIANDAMDDDAYFRFLVTAWQASVPHLKPGGAFYIWHPDLYGRIVRSSCEEAGLDIHQCLIWAKSSFTLGRSDYHWQHEPCLYGWLEGAAHTWLGDRTQSTLLHFEKPARNGEHPTMKPVEMFVYLIGNSCPKGGIVLTRVRREGKRRSAKSLQISRKIYVQLILQRSASWPERQEKARMTN